MGMRRFFHSAGAITVELLAVGSLMLVLHASTDRRQIDSPATATSQQTTPIVPSASLDKHRARVEFTRRVLTQWGSRCSWATDRVAAGERH